MRGRQISRSKCTLLPLTTSGIMVIESAQLLRTAPCRRYTSSWFQMSDVREFKWHRSLSLLTALTPCLLLVVSSLLYTSWVPLSIHYVYSNNQLNNTLPRMLLFNAPLQVVVISVHNILLQPTYMPTMPSVKSSSSTAQSLFSMSEWSRCYKYYQ